MPSRSWQSTVTSWGCADGRVSSFDARVVRGSEHTDKSCCACREAAMLAGWVRLEAHRRETLAALNTGVAHDVNNLLAVISNRPHVPNVRRPTFAS